jgi:hypothetical protein
VAGKELSHAVYEVMNLPTSLGVQTISVVWKGAFFALPSPFVSLLSFYSWSIGNRSFTLGGIVGIMMTMRFRKNDEEIEETGGFRLIVKGEELRNLQGSCK